MIYTALDPRFELDMLGYIPGFLSEADPRPAREQFDENYAHGGGWRPQTGFLMVDKTRMRIMYPGDPPMVPLCMTSLRDETIYLYPHEYVLILQPNGDFEISRMN